MRPGPAIASALSEALDAKVGAVPTHRVHGGCINESYRWETDRTPIFVKLASTDRLSMFEAEAAGLEELSRAHAVRVPRVLAVGATESNAYLALEWVDLMAPSRPSEWALGEQLAQLHRVTAPTFGWHRDNTIGSTPQINKRTDGWVDFFREHRLRYQLDLAQRNGYAGRLQERAARLLDGLNAFFADHRPVASLLHGDLWGGNWSADSAGAPVLFDPAVYFGDRETDIAMTRLFGGFGAAFYDAYEAIWPADPGAATRALLYNLYHVLNHLNLFGEGYLPQAEAMIDGLLAELRV